MHGCSPRETRIPEGLVAMRFGSGGGHGHGWGGWDMDWAAFGGDRWERRHGGRGGRRRVFESGELRLVLLP